MIPHEFALRDSYGGKRKAVLENCPLSSAHEAMHAHTVNQSNKYIFDWKCFLYYIFWSKLSVPHLHANSAHLFTLSNDIPDGWASFVHLSFCFWVLLLFESIPAEELVSWTWRFCMVIDVSTHSSYMAMDCLEVVGARPLIWQSICFFDFQITIITMPLLFWSKAEIILSVVTFTAPWYLSFSASGVIWGNFW